MLLYICAFKHSDLKHTKLDVYLKDVIFELHGERENSENLMHVKNTSYTVCTELM